MRPAIRLIVVLACVATPSALHAATFRVTSMSDSGAGSLREVITKANASPDDDWISINAMGMIQLTSALPSLSTNITIAGPGASLFSVRGAGVGSFRVFSVAGGAKVEISGLKVTNGHGGIYNAGTLTLRNCVVTGNSVAGFGGGIDNEGKLTIEDSSITANTTTGSSGNGAGIRTGPGATVTVLRSTISDNVAEKSGGGIHGGVGMTLTESTIANNRASRGGGINLQVEESGDVLITNCTISGNVATEPTNNFAGGGIVQIVFFDRTLTSTLKLINTTITGNSAYSGGGIYSQNFSADQSTLSLALKNTIVAGNTVASQGPDLFVGATTVVTDHNLIGNGSEANGFTNGVNGDQVGIFFAPIDPLLGPLASNGGPTQTHALLTGSPAINAGTFVGAPATDQRGIARSGVPDIGAYEVSTNAPPVIKTIPATITQCSSAAAVYIANVSDFETAPEDLSIVSTPIGESGVTLSSLSIDSAGQVRATVVASCAATDSTFTLTVTDLLSASTSATLPVTVTPIAAPSFSQ